MTAEERAMTEADEGPTCAPHNYYSFKFGRVSCHCQNPVKAEGNVCMGCITGFNHVD